MLSVRRLAAVAAFCVVVAPLAAQRSDPRLSPQEPERAIVAAPAPAPAPDSGALSFAPAAERLSVGVRAPAAQPAPTPSPLLLPRRGDSSQNRALMIIGGATLLAGAIIGGNAGTIIMIGGAGIGLYGLYQYLQ